MFTAMAAKQNRYDQKTSVNQAKGILKKPSLHFCMISIRWLWLLEALLNCPLRSKRIWRRKMSILEKPKLHVCDEAICGETTFWNDIALWNFQNGHLLAQEYRDTPCMANNAPPIKTAPVKKSKKGHLDGQYILTTLTNKQTRKTIEFYKFKKKWI